MPKLHRQLSWGNVALALVAVDGLAVALGLGGACLTRYYGGSFRGYFQPISPIPFLWMLIAGILWVTAFWAEGLCRRRNCVSGLREYQLVLSSGVVTIFLLIIVLYLRTRPYISRGVLLFAFVLVTLTVCVGRFALRRYVYRAARGGRPINRVLIAGTGRQAIAVARQLWETSSASVTVIGFLSEFESAGASIYQQLRVVGEPRDLLEVAERHGADLAIIVQSGLSWESQRALAKLMHGQSKVRVCVAAGLTDFQTTPMASEWLGPLLTLTPHSTRIVGIEAFSKRTLDLLLGLPELILGLALGAGIVAARLLRRERASLRPITVLSRGRKVEVWRTATPEWVARVHLARLPELLAVVRGDLSLVGPRSVEPRFVEVYQDV